VTGTGRPRNDTRAPSRVSETTVAHWLRTALTPSFTQALVPPKARAATFAVAGVRRPSNPANCNKITTNENATIAMPVNLWVINWAGVHGKYLGRRCLRDAGVGSVRACRQCQSWWGWRSIKRGEGCREGSLRGVPLGMTCRDDHLGRRMEFRARPARGTSRSELVSVKCVRVASPLPSGLGRQHMLLGASQLRHLRPLIWFQSSLRGSACSTSARCSRGQ
jgi:hypothetical protein